MVFFDPAYKKILDKAPPKFSMLMLAMDDWIVEQLRVGDVPENGLDISRNVIYSGVLIATIQYFPECSRDCLEFASRTGKTAAATYPKNLWPVVGSIMEIIVRDLNELHEHS